MVKMIPLEMPEEAIAELSEMQEIVSPLFNHVALHDTRQQRGKRVCGKQTTEQRRRDKQRQNIFQFAADVPAVKRPLMVFPVKRVESFVQESAD